MIKSSNSIKTILRAHGVMAFVTLGYILTIVFSITTSSLNHPSLRIQSDISNGLIIGSPNSIRGDEFARSTPRLIGAILNGGEVKESPLVSNPNDQLIVKQFFDHFSAIPEQLIWRIGTVLPTENGFALIFNLRLWLFLVSFIYIAKRLALSNLSILWGIALTFVAPGIIWWSWSPLIIAAPLLAGIALLDLAFRNSKSKFIGLLLVILSLSEFISFLNLYPVWVIVLAISVGLPLFIFILEKNFEQLNFKLILGSLISVGIFLLYLKYLQFQSQISLLRATEYPGERRIEALPISLSEFFDSPFSFKFQSIPGFNGSEASTTWTILLPILLILMLNLKSKLISSRFVYISTVTILFFVFWALLIIPVKIVNLIPLLSQLPPNRVATVIGIAIVLPVLVAAEQGEFLKNRNFRFVTVTLILFLTLLVGVQLIQMDSLGLEINQVWIIAFLMAMITFLAFSRYQVQKVAGLILLVLFSGLSSYRVQPIQSGLGDLNSPAAVKLKQINEANKLDTNRIYWASDTWELPALLIANNIPTINGEQSWGPSNNWKHLDSDGSQFEAYNRGASVIYVNWTSFDDNPVVSSPQADQILISVGPCNEGLRTLGVRYIVSTRQLQGGCLNQIDSFDWSSISRYIYEIK